MILEIMKKFLSSTNVTSCNRPNFFLAKFTKIKKNSILKNEKHEHISRLYTKLFETDVTKCKHIPL